MKRPSFQFYPGDWQRSPRLRMQSLAAKGLWIEMMCIMHAAEPYGHLKIGDTPLDDAGLARYVGVSKSQVTTLLRDLEELEVFSRTEDGVIFSRRMIRDEDLRNERGSHGSKAANNPKASRPGDKRGGGRPPSQTNMGFTKGLENNPLPDPIDNPPSSSSSSSSAYPSLRSGSPPWAFAVEDRIGEIRSAELRSLSTADRVVLGRFHAYFFGNCTQSESRNQTRGGSVAASLASMAGQEPFASLTVEQYVLKAREYHTVIGEKPWFRPWDIRAVLEAGSSRKMPEKASPGHYFKPENGGTDYAAAIGARVRRSDGDAADS